MRNYELWKWTNPNGIWDLIIIHYILVPTIWMDAGGLGWSAPHPASFSTFTFPPTTLPCEAILPRQRDFIHCYCTGITMPQTQAWQPLENVNSISLHESYRMAYKQVTHSTRISSNVHLINIKSITFHEFVLITLFEPYISNRLVATKLINK